MKYDLSEVQKVMEERVDPEFRAYLMQEIPKGEALLAQAKEESQEWKDVLGPLSRMYLSMNQQLGIVCQEIGYPLKQWEWDQSEPMAVLAKVFPGIEATKWYQRHLSTMLMPTDHIWLKIIPYEKKTP